MKKLALALLAFVLTYQSQAQGFKTANVVIVTIDGIRWQEVFRGADSSLINSKYTDNQAAVKAQFWAATGKDRRKLLLPFLWSEVVQNGQLYGNRDVGSKDEVANKYFFSYPGYNEIFTGFPDVRVNSNNAVDDPNTNVLEFLNRQKGLQNKVAVFASWERFPQIFNVKRSGLMVNAGFMDFTAADKNDNLKYLNQIQHKAPHYLGDSTRLDFLTNEFAMAYLKQYQPRVLYVAYDETDEMAHAGNYKFYLDRAHDADTFVQQLWAYLQSNPVYKDKTTLIITCDHGRGDSPATWRNHGFFIAPHSEQTWFAVIGPDTPPTGEMKAGETTYHKQLAQTIAKLLGYDFKAAAGHEVGDAINSVTRSVWIGAAR